MALHSLNFRSNKNARVKIFLAEKGTVTVVVGSFLYYKMQEMNLESVNTSIKNWIKLVLSDPQN